MLEALLLGGLALVQLVVLGLCLRCQAQLKELAEEIAAARQRASDEAAALVQLNELSQAARLASDVLDVGVTGVKGVHQAIAGIPFGILDAIPATRAGSRLVRGVHDSIAGGVYGAINAANKAVSSRLPPRPGQKPVALDKPVELPKPTASPAVQEPMILPSELPAIEHAPPPNPAPKPKPEGEA